MQLNRFQPVTERAQPELDADRPQYEGGIDPILTPNERTKAAVFGMDLMRQRELQNQRDEQAARDQAARAAERALLEWTPDGAA